MSVLWGDLSLNYGVPYQGSKNYIAEWVVDHLPPGDRLVDLFAGGCAITHRALLTDKWPRVLANDIDSGVQLFWCAAHGRYRDEKRWISRDDFFALKDTDPYVKWIWSFGNKGDDYMYSREIEPFKKAVNDTVTGNTPRERYAAFKRAVGMIRPEFLRNKAAQRFQTLERLERLERLEVSRLDYRQVTVRPGDVVYCDIPYKGTGAEYCKGFDHEAFYDWAEAQTVPVIISEYWMPEDRFRCVDARVRFGHMSATNNSRKPLEKLFVPINARYSPGPQQLMMDI